jgi:Sec-independent protein translocase protein TatA
MALVFFGPRKLPQISRSLGKNLAEFRRASEEFKRTWDREVTLEDTSAITAQSSMQNPEISDQPIPAPNITSVPSDQVVARHKIASELTTSSDNIDLASDRSDLASLTDEPTHSPKNDWL